MLDPNPTSVAPASVPLAAPSVKSCAEGMDAVLQPPASATADTVFFRDGDTKIRSLSSDGHIEDVTVVPGGPSSVSFFSVSPDNQRIAVLVEDLSPPTTINIRLYVEDLRGGGNHIDLYTTTTPKKGGSTLWPMGWRPAKHELGLDLVLAVVTPCTYRSIGPDLGADGNPVVHILPTNLGPTEWHVASAKTGARLATIGRAGCVPSAWPSRAGMACVDPTKHLVYIYNWVGEVLNVFPTRGYDIQSGLTPSGTALFLGGPGTFRMINPRISATNAQCAGGPNYGCALVRKNACFWIDQDHILGPDAVIRWPSGTMGAGLVSATVTPLPSSGVCAGRFPGGL